MIRAILRHRVGLLDVERKPCEELSKGMQQKIQFVAAILHEPELLILDEPFSGLDPINMRLIRNLILEQNQRGATIIFSTHVMIQAEELCDHLVMINDGVKVLDDSLEGIRARHDPRAVLLEPLDGNTSKESLAAIAGIAHVERTGSVWRLGLQDGVQPEVAIRSIVSSVAPARVELHRPSLEDIFVEIVGGASGSTDEERQLMRSALRENGEQMVGRAQG